MVVDCLLTECVESEQTDALRKVLFWYKKVSFLFHSVEAEHQKWHLGIAGSSSFAIYGVILMFAARAVYTFNSKID